jgi:phospholipid N-methyltransferase
MTSERAMFLKEFIINPRGIGSVTPSSKYLTQKMLKQLPWDTMKSVVELGAGTGVFTQYILDRKAPDCKVIAVENNDVLHYRLHKKFPEVIMGTDAQHLVSILYKNRMGRVDCVVSALPYAMMSRQERESIVAAVSGSITRNGTFVLYQYSLQMRKLLKKYFSEVHISLVVRNFPPAFVYVCKK